MQTGLVINVYGRLLQILCERHVEADFLCESNLGVIEIFLLSLKVSFDSFDCY